MSETDSSSRGLQDAGDGTEEEASGTSEPAETHKHHRHSRSGPSEVTNITITPPASPPNERVEGDGIGGRVKRVRGYVAILVVVILMGVCLAGIFTNFGHEPCNCNDLRNYFCGLVGACLMWLTGTVKDQFVK